MATEKILIFDEAGNAKRMKVRIARFLDNEPVTASDKTNIRTTLDVDDSLSGTFTTPLSVTSASNSSFTGGGNVGIGTSTPDAPIDCSGSTDNSEYAHFSNSNQRHLKLSSFSVGGNVNAGHDINASSSVGALSLSTGGSEAVRIDSSQRVGIGGEPSYDLHVTNPSTAASIGITGTGGSKDTWTVTSSDTGGKAVLNLTNADTGTTVLQLHQDNKLVLSSGGAIDFGSGASLSNYEEGTHTTTMTTTSSGTITLDSSADRLGYIIIGKHVAITGRLNVSAVSSPSGALVITLPTIPANLTEVAGSGGGCCAYYDNSAAVTWSNVPIVWDEGSNNLYIRIDASTVAASDEFRFSFVYRTT